MNRRLFVRWLGLAPVAAIVAPALAAEAGTHTLIRGGPITANSITVLSITATQIPASSTITFGDHR